jgi:hypothetical protein
LVPPHSLPADDERDGEWHGVVKLQGGKAVGVLVALEGLVARQRLECLPLLDAGNVDDALERLGEGDLVHLHFDVLLERIQ